MAAGRDRDNVIEILYRLLGDDLPTSPEEIREYYTRPEVQLVIAALTGRYGQEQRLVSTDVWGRLQSVAYMGPGVGEQYYVARYTDTFTVPAGGYSDISILPTPGYIWLVRIDRFNAPAPSGATSGNHNVRVLTADTTYYVAYHQWAYNANADIHSSVPYNTAASYPAQTSIQAGQVWYPSMYEVPLTLRYTNGTNVQQTNARTLVVTIRAIQYVYPGMEWSGA